MFDVLYLDDPAGEKQLNSIVAIPYAGIFDFAVQEFGLLSHSVTILYNHFLFDVGRQSVRTDGIESRIFCIYENIFLCYASHLIDVIV